MFSKCENILWPIGSQELMILSYRNGQGPKNLSLMVVAQKNVAKGWPIILWFFLRNTSRHMCTEVAPNHVANGWPIILWLLRSSKGGHDCHEFKWEMCPLLTTYELECGVINLVVIKNAKMMSILLLDLKTWQEDLGANMCGQTFCDYSLKDWWVKASWKHNQGWCSLDEVNYQ